MKKPLKQKYTRILYFVAGLLFLLPSIMKSSVDTATTGVGIMFIIFGIAYNKIKKSEEPPSEES